MKDGYALVIGLEIHVELKTASKMFCGCKNDPFHAPKPNIYTCPVCLGLPGALPVPNRNAVEWTLMLGLALQCDTPPLSKFDRKHYFYPDLPKGYQISQYDKPLCVHGWLDFETNNVILGSVATPESEIGADRGHQPKAYRPMDEARMTGKTKGKKRIRIHRVHLEEDTGKLLHATVNSEKVTLIDFNRSGVPLIEIVTEPDIHSAEEAKLFLKKLYQVIRYLGISDADMEKGSMRLEPNISVKRKAFSVKKENNERDDDQLPSYKVEVKNINSFKFVGKAIEYEVKRQIELLDRGETPTQETRGWDEKKGITTSQRRKEEAHDYRYFPEPDVPPMRWTDEIIEKLRGQIPELPDAKLIRFTSQYHLPVQDVERLIGEREIADYFEEVYKIYDLRFKKENITVKDIANWLLNKKPDTTLISAEKFITQINTAKTVVVVDEKELGMTIEKVITANPKAVADFKSGKQEAIMFLVGQVMKELKGKGDPKSVRKFLEKELQ